MLVSKSVRRTFVAMMSMALMAVIGITAQPQTASASPFTQSQTLDVWDDIDFDAFAYLFDQFDDQGGTLTLQSVTLTVDIDHLHAAEYENNTSEPITMEVVTAAMSYGFGGPSGLGVSEILDLSDKLGTYTIPANDSITITFFDVSLLMTDQISTDLSPYIGTDIVQIALEHDGVPFFGETAATGGSLVQPPTDDLSGTLTLTYTFIPEPASLALLGLGGLLMLKRQRRCSSL